MKKAIHISGTNNRTFCGIVRSESTIVLPPECQEFLATCQNCLGRLSQDQKYALKCFDLLREFYRSNPINKK